MLLVSTNALPRNDPGPSPALPVNLWAPCLELTTSPITVPVCPTGALGPINVPKGRPMRQSRRFSLALPIVTL